MKFFDHKTLGNHLLQLCPEILKHSVYNLKKTRIVSEIERVILLVQMQDFAIAVLLVLL